MKTKILANLASIIVTGYTCIAVAAPHWTHDEQATWWAVEDTTKTLPLNFPFAECGVGTHQSPIDLAAATFDNSKPLNKLAVTYGTDTPEFFNTGHAIQVNTSSSFAGGLKVGEETLPLIQLHFHEPSEHVIGDKKFPAELHFVHINGDGRIAVLGVAIDVGTENALFQTILDNMPTEEGGKNSTSGIQFDPAQLLPAVDLENLKYYTFAGSLTTPPCSEGVQWYLLSEIITISQAQLDKMKTFYTNNARTAQGLNGRSILTNQ
mgnify:FL=1